MIDDEKTDGTTACFCAANFSKCVEPGSTIGTKLCFTGETWYYLYNITLYDKASYETGVKEVNDVKPANGIIYDLTGHRMNKAMKGLYIMDGKKYFKK